ncbi:MAG TPA: hypothetical protein VD948_09455 [Rhodothermales bacterium]|nr:hypothetical protein [Rhodothermales bacterium]
MRNALLLALLVAFAVPVSAQTTPNRNTRETSITNNRTPRGMAPDTQKVDVLLDIPNLSVEQIKLEVDQLQANVALDARVANLVHLKAGVDASINRVLLEITGVQAELYLRVDLDNVTTIVTRTLETLQNNPEIIQTLGSVLNNTVNTVGQVGQTALQPGGVVDNAVGTLGQTLNNVTAPGGLLTQTVNTLGQTVQRTLDATGNIVETTLNATGGVVGRTVVGTVTSLTDVVSTTTNAAGQTVRRVRDEAGNVIEYVLGAGGQITNARVVQRAAGTPRSPNAPRQRN